MGGIKGLTKLQLGVESAMGTAVAATTIWRGLGRIKDDQVVDHIDEEIAIIPGADRTNIPKLAASLAMGETPATFEQLPYLFDAGIKTVAGVQDGAGTDYIYSYAAPTTALNAIKTYTIEGGDNQEAERMEYAFIKDFALKAAGGEAVKMSANWVGRQVALNAFTGALSLPVVEDVLFGKGKLYIDTAAGTIGSTQVTGTLLGFTLNVVTGWKENYTADDALYFNHLHMGMPEVTLEMTFEHNASGAARKVDWRAETARQFRLIFESGAAVATPGTTYTYKTLVLDLAGKIDDFSELGEQEGNNIVTFKVRARYNADAALFFEAIIVNELAALA